MIYDLLGRAIRTLVKNEEPAGRYRIQWDGTNDSGEGISSGTYFVKLQTKDYSEVIKLVYLK